MWIRMQEMAYWIIIAGLPLIMGTRDLIILPGLSRGIFTKMILYKSSQQRPAQLSENSMGTMMIIVVGLGHGMRSILCMKTAHKPGMAT